MLVSQTVFQVNSTLIQAPQTAAYIKKKCGPPNNIANLNI